VFESQLVLFVSWLSSTLSPATVGFYLAALRPLHLYLGLVDPTQNAQCRRRVMKGIQRCGGLANSPRLPRASEILHAIFNSLSMTLSHDLFNIWSACCIAYFGFLRASEFTTSLPFDAFTHLIMVDVTSLPVKSVGGSFSLAYSGLET
jgi:hypothetical protein